MNTPNEKEIALATLRSLEQKKYEKDIERKKIEHIIVGANEFQKAEDLFRMKLDHDRIMSRFESQPQNEIYWREP